ncbi:secretory calcium-binding phosphoprotein 9 [Astyanax mexicanus]|nr:secretory calcium-binding phosphoprotein 9 [Astyanax mexicanus]
MLPGMSPFMIQNPMAAPFGAPNPQVPMPPQPAMGFPPMGLPYLAPQNPALRQMLPPQQQAAGGMNPMGNGQQPQGDMPAGPVPRFRRTLLRRMQAKSTNTNPEVTPTPTVSSTLMN